MTETDEKPEEKKPVKQGLHGWKAALAMFGCGSLAAFGVFGIIVGVLGSFLSVFSGGAEDNPELQGVPQGEGAPMEDFNSDAFDFCDIVGEVAGSRLSYSNKGSIEDTSIDGGAPTGENLVRSDECSGSLTPEGADATDRWDFEFAYRAVIFSPGESREDISSRDLEEWMQEAESSLVNVEDSGDSPMGDDARYVYGSPESGSGSEYTVVAQKRSAVFRITLTSQDEVPLRSFDGQALQFDERLDHDFGIFIPG